VTDHKFLGWTILLAAKITKIVTPWR